MSFQIQVLLLILVILFSLAVTKVDLNQSQLLSQTKAENLETISNSTSSVIQKQKFDSFNLSYQAMALKTISSKQPLEFSETEVKKAPIRNWEVLDPEINAASVLIESLDDGFPFFYQQVYQPWPMASLTKLLTAVVVIEDIGINKKIEITPEVIATEGNSGNFQVGEIYTALDLLKIMIITSSNDAAAAFENYYGKEALVNRLNEKAKELRMTQTKIVDASGLSSENKSTAADIAKLLRYIVEKHPDILNWSRLPTLLVQPISKSGMIYALESRTLQNINPFVEDKNFFGGKTGTSPSAKQNLAAIFTFNNQRLIFIILGSDNRVKETENLLNWVGKAYHY